MKIYLFTEKEYYDSLGQALARGGHILFNRKQLWDAIEYKYDWIVGKMTKEELETYDFKHAYWNMFSKDVLSCHAFEAETDILDEWKERKLDDLRRNWESQGYLDKLWDKARLELGLDD